MSSEWLCLLRDYVFCVVMCLHMSMEWQFRYTLLVVKSSYATLGWGRGPPVCSSFCILRSPLCLVIHEFHCHQSELFPACRAQPLKPWASTCGVFSALLLPLVSLVGCRVHIINSHGCWACSFIIMILCHLFAWCLSAHAMKGAP